MASLCHPWFTTTNLSYRFPVFETSAAALCCTTGTQTLLHTNTSSHRDFYAQALLHKDPFTHRRFYTQTLLHTHRCFNTQTLLHTDAFTHKHFYRQSLLHTETFTHSRFYIQTLLHTETFTHSTQKLVYRLVYTRTEELQFYCRFWRSNFISCERVAPDDLEILSLPQFLAIEPHFVRKGCAWWLGNRKVTAVFGDRTSFRAKGLRRMTWKLQFYFSFWRSNFTSVFGDRISFRAKRVAPGTTWKSRFLAIKFHFVRKGCVSCRLVGTAPAPAFKREIRRGQEGKRRRCEDVRASGQEGKRRRCEDVRMWRCEDVRMRGCEDEQMWECKDVKMSRYEDEKIWRWEDVKMRRCED